MFIIFGWGHRDIQDKGPALKIKCPRCSNVEFWNLLHVRNFFTFFFIPVFPYENKKMLLCPVCRTGFELPEALASRIQMIAEFHDQYARKNLTEFEYKTKIDNNYDTVFNEFMQYINELEKQADNGILCPACGKIAHTENGGLFIDKSCTKCGVELPMVIIRKVKAAFPEKWKAQ